MVKNLVKKIITSATKMEFTKMFSLPGRFDMSLTRFVNFKSIGPSVVLLMLKRSSLVPNLLYVCAIGFKFDIIHVVKTFNISSKSLKN